MRVAMVAAFASAGCTLSHVDRGVDVAGDWGVTPSGERWTEQVTMVAADYGIGTAPDGEGAVYIDPHGESGSFQIGLPSVELFDDELQIRATWDDTGGTGTLAPVGLVARQLDVHNHVRAELIENVDDHTMEIDLVAVANGENTYLAATALDANHSPGDWWYLRFHFEGAMFDARAWKMGTLEPIDWQVTANATSASSGSIAVRSQNSGSSERPIVYFDDFGSQSGI